MEFLPNPEGSAALPNHADGVRIGDRQTMTNWSVWRNPPIMERLGAFQMATDGRAMIDDASPFGASGRIWKDWQHFRQMEQIGAFKMATDGDRRQI